MAAGSFESAAPDHRGLVDAAVLRRHRLQPLDVGTAVPPGCANGVQDAALADATQLRKDLEPCTGEVLGDGMDESTVVL